MEKLKDDEPTDPEELHKKEAFLVKRKTIELNEFPKTSDLFPPEDALAKVPSEEEETPDDPPASLPEASPNQSPANDV